jgi:hypothetical protein
MNPTLAALYGTGLAKTAAEAPIDLNDLDLETLSDDDLVALAEMVEDGDYDEGDETIEKMAQDGSLEYWDTAGRVMAHAYADELGDFEKEAEAIEVDFDYMPDEFAVSDLSGDELVWLIDSGEYEMDKTAGVVSKMRGYGRAGKDAFLAAMAQGKLMAGQAGSAARRSSAGRQAEGAARGGMFGAKAGRKAGKALHSAESAASRFGGAVKDTAKGGRAQRAYKQLKRMKAEGQPMNPAMKRELKELGIGAAQTSAMYATPAVLAALAAKGSSN